MRGKRRGACAQCLHVRIIPARAGQTPALMRAISVSTDHPRACGANQGAPADPWSQDGSSPRVRGKLGVLDHSRHLGRIIPARAGQTRRVQIIAVAAPDHPRACGANDTAGITSSATHGSSPRVRGKQADDIYSAYHARIIPARAGQTLSIASVICIYPDHPRACGANLTALIALLTSDGSSPRVRGKPVGRGEYDAIARIIPARAGQTTVRRAYER